jgi:hypothetical protein
MSVNQAWVREDLDGFEGTNAFVFVAEEYE